MTRGLSMQWNCPVLTTEGFEPQTMALVMPRLFVEELNLLPLRIAASRLLYLAFEDRLDASAAFSLQQMSDLKVESGLLEGEALARTRERLLSYEFVPATQESMRDTEQMILRVGEVLEERQPIAARLVRVQRYYWLRTWLEAGTQGPAGYCASQHGRCVGHDLQGGFLELDTAFEGVPPLPILVGSPIE